jgi:tripartite-type tricarboxylate transporter receptor subunit TctC
MGSNVSRSAVSNRYVNRNHPRARRPSDIANVSGTGGVKSRPGWQGLFAPAGTLAPIIEKLADEVSRIFALPEVVSALQKVGGEALPMRPGAFAQFVRAERSKWAEVVKSAGIRID